MLLYYFPENSKSKPPFEGGTRREISGGPDGKSGAIISQGEKVGFWPDKQKWTQVEDYWICVDGPVNPEDLLCDEVIDGHWVKLEDGNKWLIPVARVFAGGTKIPEALVLGPDNELVLEALPRFAEFYKDAEKAWGYFAEQKKLPFTEIYDIAVKALSLNYRLGRHEVSALKLLTTNNFEEVLGAIVDYPVIKEELKKKVVEDSANSNDGGQA